MTQGAGEQYLSAFALLLEATPFHLSILSALPQVLGTWAQLASVKIAPWFPSRKSQVLWAILGQSAAWIPILALPLLWPHLGPWLLIAAVAVYFACTHFATPAWNGLITDLLDPDERGMYFARRARVMALTSFVALCLGGLLVSLFERMERAWIGFAIMFLLAGLLRSLSVLPLLKVTDVVSPRTTHTPAGFLHFLQARSSHNFQRFLLFSGLMHGAVLVAGPFFVIYIIEDLQLAYWQYGIWLAAGIIGQFVSLTTWGEFGDRFGNKALLTMTGYLVPVLPMLYLVSTAWPFLLLVNFFGGIVWAGLALGLQNYVFDAVARDDRPKAVAVANVVNAVGWAGGTLVGTVLIGIVPNTLEWGGLEFHRVSNLPWIFFLSGALRLLISSAFLGQFRELRPVPQEPYRRMMWELPVLKSLNRFAAQRHRP